MNEETSEESEEMRHRMETKGRVESLLRKKGQQKMNLSS